MAQHAHVPKFGNWESDGDVPYTQYFDNARKGRDGEGKLINPNDPEQNLDAFSEDVAPIRAPPFRASSDLEVPKPKHEQRTSKEDGDLHRFTDSPARHDAVGQKPGSDSSHHRHGDRPNPSDPHRRASRVSGGSDRSIEHSPLHPQYQVKSVSKAGVSYPSWERKASPEGGHGLAPNTTGRSRMRPANLGDETPDKDPAVPKFGDWDESNPSSADGYTHIFNKVREEKQVGLAKVPNITTDPTYSDGRRQANGGNFDFSEIASSVLQGVRLCTSMSSPNLA